MMMIVDDFFCAECVSAESRDDTLRLAFATNLGATIKAHYVVLRLSKDEFERLWAMGPDDPTEFLELLTKERIAKRDS